MIAGAFGLAFSAGAEDRLRADISGGILFFEQEGVVVERPATARVRIESRLGSIRRMEITSEWVGEEGQRQEMREIYIVRGRQYAGEIERIFAHGDDVRFSRTAVTGRVEQRIRGKSGSGKIEWSIDEVRRFGGFGRVEPDDFFEEEIEEFDEFGDEFDEFSDEEIGDEPADGEDAPLDGEENGENPEDGDFEDLDGDGVPDDIDPEVEVPQLDVLEEGQFNVALERSLSFKADWRKEIKRPKVRLIEVGEEFFSADLLRRQEADLAGTGRGSLAFSEKEAEQARIDAQPTPTPTPTPEPDDEEDFDGDENEVIDEFEREEEFDEEFNDNFSEDF